MSLIRTISRYVFTGGLPILFGVSLVALVTGASLTSTEPMTWKAAGLFGLTVFITGVILELVWDARFAEEQNRFGS